MISNRDTKAEVAARLSPFLDEWGAVAGGWVPTNYGQVRDQLNLIAIFNDLPTIAPGEMGGDARAKINALLALENYRKLDLNFGTNWGYLIGPGGRSGPVASLLSVSRASGGIYFDASRVLRTAGNNVLRLDHDPVTGEPKGALIESAATNYLTNNMMAGAAVGTPGSLPTGWTPVLNGLSQEVAAVGVEDGINYCDIRIFGTPSATWAAIDLGAFAGVFIAGGAATVSMFVRRKAGSLTNVASVSINNRAFLAPSGFADITVPISSALAAGDGTLRTARFEIANAPAGGVTGVGNAYILIEPTGAIDVTLRIGLPQMERGTRASSPIKTTTAAATRAADIVSIPTSAFPLNPNEGTIYAEWSSNSPIEGAVANLDTGSKNAPPYLRMGVSSLTGGRILAEYAPGQTLDFNEGVATDIAQPVKAAFAYSGVDHAISTNGRAAKTGITPVPASGFTRLLIGDAAWFTAPNGHIKRLVYFPRWLSNAELQAMTS